MHRTNDVSNWRIRIVNTIPWHRDTLHESNRRATICTAPLGPNAGRMFGAKKNNIEFFCKCVFVACRILPTLMCGSSQMWTPATHFAKTISCIHRSCQHRFVVPSPRDLSLWENVFVLQLRFRSRAPLGYPQFFCVCNCFVGACGSYGHPYCGNGP